jgi:hypothetical protein
VDVILAALGGKIASGSNLRHLSSSVVGDEGSQMPHSFKSSSFSIPTQCGYCKVRRIFAFNASRKGTTHEIVQDINLGFEQTRQDMQTLWAIRTCQV